MVITYTTFLAYHIGMSAVYHSQCIGLIEIDEGEQFFKKKKMKVLPLKMYQFPVTDFQSKSNKYAFMNIPPCF